MNDEFSYTSSHHPWSIAMGHQYSYMTNEHKYSRVPHESRVKPWSIDARIINPRNNGRYEYHPPKGHWSQCRWHQSGWAVTRTNGTTIFSENFGNQVPFPNRTNEVVPRCIFDPPKCGVPPSAHRRRAIRRTRASLSDTTSVQVSAAPICGPRQVPPIALRWCPLTCPLRCPLTPPTDGTTNGTTNGGGKTTTPVALCPPSLVVPLVVPFAGPPFWDLNGPSYWSQLLAPFRRPTTGVLKLT